MTSFYKGFNYDTKEWCIGDLMQTKKGIFIVQHDSEDHEELLGCPKEYFSEFDKVLPESIGQFVGLKDVNKKQIFDKVDVVKFKFEETKNNFIELTGTFFFDDTELRYQIEIIDNPAYLCLNYMFDRMSEFEIIKSIEE